MIYMKIGTKYVKNEHISVKLTLIIVKKELNKQNGWEWQPIKYMKYKEVYIYVEYAFVNIYICKIIILNNIFLCKGLEFFLSEPSEYITPSLLQFESQLSEFQGDVIIRHSICDHTCTMMSHFHSTI